MIDAGDTIVAIATPPGRGALGVVRVSGPDAVAVARELLGQVPPPRHAGFRRFLDADNTVIDEGIALVFKAPASFTGEDMFELHAHGSPIVLDQLVARIASLGVRLAGPGEFSRRAFENGKYDLTQLEAIADLIASVGISATRSAQRSLQGAFSAQLRELCDSLAELRAQVETALDFSDEDIDLVQTDQIAAALEGLTGRIAEVHRRALQGAALRGGAEVVIAGQPNVGKSSLLNCLAGREEAIVSPTAGTTRDVLKSDVLIEGLPVRILDTAGLRPPDDEIEREGVRRARAACCDADLVLLVADACVGFGEFEQRLADEFESDGVLWFAVYNKHDLAGVVTDGGLKNALRVSAKTGEGIDALAAEIAGRLRKAGGADEVVGPGEAEDAIIARRRHLAALADAKDAVGRAGDSIAIGAVELVAEELRAAQQALGTITGTRTTEDLLGDIFSRFCIGK